jgi:hypothetical protein
MVASYAVGSIKKRSGTFKTEDVKLLYEQKFDEMREREGRPVCGHVKRTEKGSVNIL